MESFIGEWSRIKFSTVERFYMIQGRREDRRFQPEYASFWIVKMALNQVEEAEHHSTLKYIKIGN